MKIEWKQAAVAATAVIGMAAHAQFASGNRLLERLDGTNPYERGFGLGYVLGVTDLGYGFNHCPPESVTAGQLRDVVQQYLQANPATRNQSADLLVARALRAVWPCGDRKGSSM